MVDRWYAKIGRMRPSEKLLSPLYSKKCPSLRIDGRKLPPDVTCSLNGDVKKFVVDHVSHSS